MDWSAMVTSVLRVLLAGLVFGAGLPALFAVGVSLWHNGSDDIAGDGSIRAGNRLALAGASVPFAVVIAAVGIGILWITQKSLNHYFGITVFGS